VIGEFDYISAFTPDQVEVRVYTPIGKVHLANFALETAVKALTFYNEFFELKYPLPKADLVAIPDFAAGAVTSNTQHSTVKSGENRRSQILYHSLLLHPLMIVCLGQISSFAFRRFLILSSFSLVFSIFCRWRIGAWSPTARLFY